jgi:hypothetical protein
MSVETGRYRVERRGNELVVVDGWTGRVVVGTGYDVRYPSSRRAALRFAARLEQEQSDGDHRSAQETAGAVSR